MKVSTNTRHTSHCTKCNTVAHPKSRNGVCGRMCPSRTIAVHVYSLEFDKKIAHHLMDAWHNTPLPRHYLQPHCRNLRHCASSDQRNQRVLAPRNKYPGSPVACPHYNIDFGSSHTSSVAPATCQSPPCFAGCWYTAHG